MAGVFHQPEAPDMQVRDRSRASRLSAGWLRVAVQGYLAIAGDQGKPMIRAGTMEEAQPESGDWVFVDVGFSQNKSCGILEPNGRLDCFSFADAKNLLADLASVGDAPLNLVLEAPLSACFSSDGNPVGRSIERRGQQTRYWHTGIACSVFISAAYMLRAVLERNGQRDVRLFEGFVSFKEKGVKSDHRLDVGRLRDVVWRVPGAGRIVPPETLRSPSAARIASAFEVCGLDFGVPPVILVEPQDVAVAAQ
jgi:hypothetical protein